MPREGVLGQATRIDPVPADHEALSRGTRDRDLGPDEYLCALYEELPDEVLATITRLAASLG